MTTTSNSSAGKALGLAIALGVTGLCGKLLGFWMLMEPAQAATEGPVLWPGLAFVLVGLAFDLAGAAVLLKHAGKRS